MADIVRMTTVTNRVTRATLYDLVEDAQLQNIVQADCVADALLGFVVVGTDPTTMTHGQWWFDQAEQLLRVFDSDTSYALAQGPDRFETVGIAMEPIERGMGVRIDALATYSDHSLSVSHPPLVRKCGPTSLDWLDCYAIAAASADSGARIPICTDGFVPAFFGAAHRGTTPNPTTFAVGVSGPSGIFGAVTTGDSALSQFAVQGQIMERPWNTAASNVSMCIFINFYGSPRYWPDVGT